MGSDALRKGTWSARGYPAVNGGGLSTRGAKEGVRGARQAAPARSEAGPRGIRGVACAGAVGALLACGNHAPDCHGERCGPVVINVMTWWSNTASSPGASLRDAAKDQPGAQVEVNLTTKSSKDEMMASLAAILSGTDKSERVDAFLTHPGGDLLRWTPCGGDDPPHLRVLNGPNGYPDLTTRFEPRVLQALQCCPSGTACESPQVYAVPLGLHQINHIISSKERFAKCAGVQVTNVDSFVDLLRCLDEDGRRVISVPIGTFQEHCDIGQQACWKSQDVAGQSLQYLLESLFLLSAGPDAYEAHWTGRCWQQDRARANALLGEVLIALDRVRPYLNHCSGAPCTPPPQEFGEALTEVSEGYAALVVAPDWNQFTKAGQSQYADRSPFPGTSGTFLFTTDSFALPALPDVPEEAGLRWMDTLLQPQVQTRFAEINSARPALGDHSQLGSLLPSLEVLLPPGADLLPLRQRLNAWAEGDFKEPAPALDDIMDGAFGAARDKGLLPARAGDATACELP